MSSAGQAIEKGIEVKLNHHYNINISAQLVVFKGVLHGASPSDPDAFR